MTIEDLTLIVLAVWLVPLILFAFFFSTDPVRGTRHARRPFDVRTLEPISKIVLAQKFALIAVIVFIFITRLIGDFPGREWVALILYGALNYLAWAAFVDLRRLQRPQDDFMRAGK